MRPTWFDDWIRWEATIEAHKRDAKARVMAKELLPNRLAWLVDGTHLRLLRFVYRLRPSWRPVMTIQR